MPLKVHHLDIPYRKVHEIFGCHTSWLSSLGLVINWYGDSLDGTLARVRQLLRPKYGFFIDHSLDAITVCFMFLGGGLSPIFKMEVAMLMLIGYLVLSVYTYICTIIKDEFLLTYGGGFGPTEMRLVIILLNTVVMYTPWVSLRYSHWVAFCSIYFYYSYCF